MASMERIGHRVGQAVMVAVVVLIGVGSGTEVFAQEDEHRTIELETIEIESEVPERVAQFFVQRGQLQYQELEEHPSFLDELLKSVDEDPF